MGNSLSEKIYLEFIRTILNSNKGEIMFSKLYPLSIFMVIYVLSSMVMAADHHEMQEQMSGFRGEFIGQIQFVEGRLSQLLQAMPAKDFDWRPGEGVRSVGEVYMHTAFGNYLFIKVSGQPLPEGINIDMKPQEWDVTVSGKEAIAKVMERSFKDLEAAAKNISESDLDKTVKVFGMEMTIRNFMISSLNHLHEHLGQAIAYARINGIVPPWTAAQQKAEAK